MAGPIIIDYDDISRPGRRGAGGGIPWGLPLIFGLLVALLLSARTIAGFAIEYAWWAEMEQTETWFAMLRYSILPTAAAWLFLAIVWWAAYAAGAGRRGVRAAGLMVAAFALLAALMLADSWTVVRYFGALADPSPQPWTDPVFGNGLPFYFFELPFYGMLLRLALAASFGAIFVYWIGSRIHTLDRLRDLGPGGTIDFAELGLNTLLESTLAKVAASVFLVTLAARFYLDRYDYLFADHGFLVGVDYVNETINIPANWAAVAACVVAAGLLFAGRIKWAGLLVVAANVIPGLIAGAVNWAFVRPNEISIQRPYIERHIAATRSAYGLAGRTREIEFPTQPEGRLDPVKQKPLLDNVRLWDWRAFHDTITQIQGLRPYYVFPDSDVDRYRLPDANGAMRLQQVLLSPRELDVTRLGDARSGGWINPRFIYTHGYGVVVAEANRITADGSPYLYIQNAPPEIRNPALKLTRPEIYYGEVVHEPVFVRTGQSEFNYPSGSGNTQTRYEGRGGFPVSSFGIRLAAAVSEGDWNILLTGYLAPESRMMIRRKVRERLSALADFVDWDADPYLVLTREGRMVWMVDGYTSSARHPYSRRVRTDQLGSINYIRNSVKATVDAYDGTVRLYVFDDADPVIRAYSRLFPRLFLPASAMPAELREHARYPETIFRVQAEIYRTFHMLDPEAFYNKEDLWDLAKTTASQEGEAAPSTPTYVVATLADSKEPEFLLMIPFTPRNKDNLIGLMVARCDGERLGEIVMLQLSKQELIFGPMQINARINQDQNIAKDLTLWNQQGSKVIRGQMLVLPIDDTFLYVTPIYLQAAQAPMPQLRKVALAVGSRIAYADTYQEALAQIASGSPPPREPESPGPPIASQPTGAVSDKRLDDLRARMRRYRELMAQGKFAEAGRELEAIESVLK
ncbi:MAG: UPF0182 family protein [Bryobacteraceae bacterium]|nr:UPF0182 family protein [Bryobacteraceae bacterium]